MLLALGNYITTAPPISALLAFLLFHLSLKICNSINISSSSSSFCLNKIISFSLIGRMRASAAQSFLKLLAENLDVVAGPVVTLVYPLYASIRAIETKSVGDDRQWLTYWVLYSMITLFELTFATLIEWLPFWAYAKLMFTCWLVIPYFSGAASVYNNVVRPYIVTRQKSINVWYVPKIKDIFSKPDDVITAAEKYIQHNGPEAFEKIIQRNNSYMASSKFNNNFSSFYDDEYKYEDEHRY